MYPTMKKFRKYLIKRELPITEKVTNQKTNGLTGVNILVKGSAWEQQLIHRAIIRHLYQGPG